MARHRSAGGSHMLLIYFGVPLGTTALLLAGILGSRDRFAQVATLVCVGATGFWVFLFMNRTQPWVREILTWPARRPSASIQGSRRLYYHLTGWIGAYILITASNVAYLVLPEREEATVLDPGDIWNLCWFGALVWLAVCQWLALRRDRVG